MDFKVRSTATIALCSGALHLKTLHGLNCYRRFGGSAAGRHAIAYKLPIMRICFAPSHRHLRQIKSMKMYLPHEVHITKQFFPTRQRLHTT